MTFASQLRSAREALRLTQPELARAIGCSMQSVSNWETGRNVPREGRQAQILEHVAGLRAPIGRCTIIDRIAAYEG